MRFPIRIYHGDKDQTVPLSYSARLEAVLKENGGQAELVVVPGIGHENAIMKHTADSFLEFLERLNIMSNNRLTNHLHREIIGGVIGGVKR